MEKRQKLLKLKTQRFLCSKAGRHVSDKLIKQQERCVSGIKQLQIEEAILRNGGENGNKSGQRKANRAQLYIPLSATITFSIIKQMSYFQKWNEMYSGEFLKSIVPYFCWTVREFLLDHQEFVYFLLKRNKNCPQKTFNSQQRIDNQNAILLEETYQPDNNISCLKINRHMVQILDNVLNRIIFKQNQVRDRNLQKIFKGLSLQQKFWMLCQSKRIVLSFNQFLIRKGAKINSIFLTVKGQFSELQGESSIEKRYFSHNQFFGFEQIANQESAFKKSIRSHANGSVAFEISADLLLKYLNIKLSQKRLPSINLPSIEGLTKNSSSHIDTNYSGSVDKLFVRQKRFNIQLKKDNSKGQTEYILDKKDMKTLSVKYRQFQELVGPNDTIKQVFKDSFFLEHMKRYSLSKQKQAVEVSKKQRFDFFKKSVNKSLKNRQSVDNFLLKNKTSNQNKSYFQHGSTFNQISYSPQNQRDSVSIIMRKLRKLQKQSKNKKTFQLIKKGKYYLRG